jgi:hypothetical protein
LPRLFGIGGEGGGARIVVDAEMVLVPIAAVFTQPCCLEARVSAVRAMGAWELTGMGPMKKRLDVR